MALTLDISLDKDIKEINAFFDDLKFKAITVAARQGLNRTARGVRSDALKEVRKRRNLKLKDAKDFVRISKAKGTNITTLEASVKFSGVPLPLILFLIGQKTPKIQTKPNPRRRSRSVSIVKGRRSKRPGIFVQKAERGRRRYQVFRRKDPSDKSKGFVKQSAPSIASFLQQKANILRKIENSAIARLQRDYDAALANQLRKLKL